MTAWSATIVGTNVGADLTLTAPCSPSAGADLFCHFVVPGPSPELVYADTVGSSFDTVPLFARECTTPPAAGSTAGEVLCDDLDSTFGCTGRSESTAVTRLTSGTWSLVERGYDAGAGTLNLRVQHVAVGSGVLAHLPAGSTAHSGATCESGQIGGACGGFIGATLEHLGVGVDAEVGPGLEITTWDRHAFRRLLDVARQIQST